MKIYFKNACATVQVIEKRGRFSENVPGRPAIHKLPMKKNVNKKDIEPSINKKSSINQ